jgi:hypothetical protein
MGKFLDIYNQTKLNQDISHLHNPITSNKIEAIIESPYREEPELDGFMATFYQTFTNTNTPQTFPGIRKGRNTIKFII